jgi:uncharacterized membrane protein
MHKLTLPLVLTSTLFSAAIFGFFYAWVCSTMWGLDAADPTIAIQAMQAMNASVRNAVFAPAFFGTPIILFITAALLWAQSYRTSAALFATSAVVNLCLGVFLTMAVNVPMNEALALVETPTDYASAQKIWLDYSPTWQFWNQTRTIATGISFLIAIIGVLNLPLYRPAH